MRSWLSIALFCLFPCVIARTEVLGQLPLPELNALRQLGAQKGTPITPLQDATGVRLGQSSALFSNEQLQPTQLPAEAIPGLYQLSAASELGVTNSRSFLVTADPWVVAAGNENSDSAVPVTLQTYYQDECPERGRNYYRFKSELDQTIRIQAMAFALDSRARLVLALQSPALATIASASASNDADPAIVVSVKANTEYTLVIHDHLFRGGAEFRYAIHLEASPTGFALPKPLVEDWIQQANFLKALQNDSPNHGPSVPEIWQTRATILRLPQPTSANLQHIETESPNGKAMKVAWPCVVSGEFQSNGDSDSFDIECEPNTDVMIECVSHRLSEPTDSALLVYRVDNPGQPNEKLSRVAENDDMPAIGYGELRFPNKDSMSSFKSADKGTYRVMLLDQQNSNRKSRVPRYAMEIRRPQPGFALAASSVCQVRDPEQARLISSTICVGGASMVSVHAFRFDGFNAPIEISVSGLMSDCRGGSGIMAADQNIATINLWHDSQSEPATPPGTLSRLTVKGMAKIGEQSFESIATPVEVVWNATDTFRSPTAKIAHRLQLAKSNITCPITVELGTKDANSVDPIVMPAVRGTPLKIPVRVTRRTGGESPITVRLHHTPTKTTAAEIKIEPNVNDGVLDLQIPKDAPVGDYLLGALCEVAVTLPNPDPAAAEKTVKYNLQLPSSNIRLRIGD